ncbi:MAG: XRE family transcriptional regulator [Acetobacteraceae bacterium]|jgi:ribosome-binding protein aMBF1 (putative translation factor)
MAGHRPIASLRDRMSPERRARNAEAARSTLRDIERAACALHELRQARQARQRSQEDLARALKMQQPAIAKLEHRADMYVSNLRRYIEALGGTLEITARFPDGEVTITNFRDVGEEAATPACSS